MLPRIAAILTTATLALSGCKTFVEADLFTSDLMLAAEGNQLRSPATLGLEMSGESECREKSAALHKAIAENIDGAEFIGCGKKGYETVAEFRVPLAISAINADSGTPDDAFAIGVRNDADGKIAVVFRTNGDALRRIWDSLPEEMTQYQRFEPEYRLSAVINNDLREPVTILTDDVFADGAPLFDERKTTLERRGQITIALSDVSNTAFGRSSTWVPIARLENPD